MFPTFISILDIQSWWEVPSIAHFCSLFRTAFNLLDFDIEDLEEALLTDGTEETSWLQELIVRLLSGCLPNNEISTFNYQMFLRRLFRQKCQEHDRYNPFNTDCDFTLLPLRTKVDILHALCDFRLDAEDVLDQLKNLEADSLRVEPLGYDKNESAYWYFYGTRLYREDFEKKNNKKTAVWQVICFTEEDWFQLTKKFKNSSVKSERALYHSLSKNFLPELPRLFKEKESQARRRLLENQPRRVSNRIKKLDETTKDEKLNDDNSDLIEDSESRHAMGAKKKHSNKRPRRGSTDSGDKDLKRKKSRRSEEPASIVATKPVGRQTNNSLSALDGQIVIQPKPAATSSGREKLKTSQVFRQTEEDIQVGMHKILDFVKNHDDAWPFLDPVEEEYAPNYYSIIRRPMDLTKMEEKLDQGLYKSVEKFRHDFQLIVNNCRLYNGAENEYTEMVDNLLKVFDKAAEKYLDKISSSDEEIAVVLDDTKSVIKSKKKKEETRKLSSKKRDRSASTEKKVRRNDEDRKSKKTEEDRKSKKYDEKSKKVDEDKKSKKYEDDKKSKSEDRKTKKVDHKKIEETKKKKEKPIKPVVKEVKKRGRKKRKDSGRGRSYSQSSSSRSSTPESYRSKVSTPPPSSPDSRDFYPSSRNPWSCYSDEPPRSESPDETGPFKPKDKHNKLRETIEKLKAKSEIRLQSPGYEFDDHLKENKKIEKKSRKVDTPDHSKGRKSKTAGETKQSNYEALSLATEQTLKDINKWLDDTPKFGNEFSSASNSPAYIGVLDDFDLLAPPRPFETKKVEKPIAQRISTPPPLPPPPPPPTVASKKELSKDVKKKPLRDPSKFFGKRREIQRTIDRLQPGKSKGNLISNVQTTPKPGDEAFPPLAKIKDTKNSLIVKTDTNAPKLSLGSVLDSFGKHKFADEKKESGELKEVPKVEEEKPILDKEIVEKKEVLKEETTPVQVETEQQKDVKEEEAAGGPTPNLSAWFKAFGAPKAPAPQKKPEKGDAKEEDAKSERVPLGDPSPSLESPQPSRQRRTSTGSSVSERSSFSQDLDSPRVGMDERGAYPAPYPSPMHRSPSSGASPVMASPRPDISPRSDAYPFSGGQMRVGFYQDTVASSKSSPDKSCSPRENPPNSPYYQPTGADEHVYAPNTQPGYTGSYNAPYYTHPPNYSSTNPTPPYNMEGGSNSYYDTSKIVEHYQGKPPQNYTANSPASSQNSPAPQPQLSPHSPMVHMSQSSPSMHSPSIHSPQMPSPAQSLHSPGINQVSSPQMTCLPDSFHPPAPPPQPQEEPPPPPHQPMEKDNHQQQMFPVKKRAFMEADLQYQAQCNMQQQQQQQQQQGQPQWQHQERFQKQFEVEKEHLLQQQMAQRTVASPSNLKPMNYPPAPVPTATQFNAPYNREYTMNRPQQKLDLSKFTNMGYAGPDVNFTRALQQQYGRPDLNYTRTTVQSAISQATQLLNSHPLTSQASSYQKPNQQQSYPMVDPDNATFKQDTRPPYNAAPPLELEQALGLGRNLVDRYNNEQRQMMANSYYNDKMSQMFNKPLFAQSNMGYQQQPTQAQQAPVQQQQQQMFAQEVKPAEKKKTKKKKGVQPQQPPPPPQEVPQTTYPTYTNLKPPSTTSSALDSIALKSSSVPGSAFNFGTGLSESYPNILDDFRGTPNYFGPAKPGQPAQGYPPFLNPAAHQTRPPYPLGGPFMDTGSQLYQHYLQAGVLNQGLLGAAPGGYPPGYHPLAMTRQPYDSMTRPSWL